MSSSAYKLDKSITKTSASLTKDYLIEKRAAQRIRRISFPDYIVRNPGGAWSYIVEDIEPTVAMYTIVCSDKPLTKPE